MRRRFLLGVLNFSKVWLSVCDRVWRRWLEEGSSEVFDFRGRPRGRVLDSEASLLIGVIVVVEARDLPRLFGSGIETGAAALP